MKTAREWIKSIADNNFQKKVFNNFPVDCLDNNYSSLSRVINEFVRSWTIEWIQYRINADMLALNWKIAMKDGKESFAVECPKDYTINERWRKYIKYLKKLWMGRDWTTPINYYWVDKSWCPDWRIERNKFWTIYDLDSEFVTQLIWEESIVKKIDEENNTITIRKRRPYKLQLNPSF